MGHRCHQQVWRGKSTAGKQHSRALNYAHGTLDTAPERGKHTQRSETATVCSQGAKRCSHLIGALLVCYSGLQLGGFVRPLDSSKGQGAAMAFLSAALRYTIIFSFRGGGWGITMPAFNFSWMNYCNVLCVNLHLNNAFEQFKLLKNSVAHC